MCISPLDCLQVQLGHFRDRLSYTLTHLSETESAAAVLARVHLEGGGCWMALVGDKTSARVVEALLVLADQVAVERLRLEPVEAKVANQVFGALKHFLALA